MKIVIIGGHLTPALSVIEELPADAEVLYIGRKHTIEGDAAISLEYETISKKNIPFVSLKTGRFQRSLTMHTIPSLTKIPFGYFQAIFLLKKFNPDVVLGFGGYVSVPVALAAKTLRIPVVIHEQTLEAGAANVLVSKFAKKICISFETSRKYFPKNKVELTGNPIRKTVFHPAKKIEIEETGPVIFITGGSQGSHAINLLVQGSLTKLLDKFTIVHQTGDSQEFRDFDKLLILKEELNNNKRNKYYLSKFFSPEEIGSILKSADLIVSRAGINTVSELIFLKKPSYLIPIPISQKNEQVKNASYLKSLGLGEIGEQKNLTPESFYKDLNDMIGNINNYKLKDSSKKFPKNAAQKIIDVTYAASKNNN